MNLKLIWYNLRETEKLAQKIAKRLEPKSFISLRGKLGVGKTTLASLIINNLSKKKIRVLSPTFSLVNIYDLKNIKVWHYDLFRLSNKKEIFELDFELALLDCVIVEWPEIITEYLPHKRIEIQLDEDESLLRYATVRRINNKKFVNLIPKMIDEIIKKLDHKKIKFDNLQFLAGDASDRKYFLIKQQNNTNVLMVDKDSENLERFLKISYLLKEHVSIPKIITDLKEDDILIIENFNKNKFSEVLKKSNRIKLYKVALDALLYIHKKKLIKNLFITAKKSFLMNQIYFSIGI